MMERRYAIITGADGGMGREITRAVAAAGYYVIMACYNPSAAEPVRQRIAEETGSGQLEILQRTGGAGGGYRRPGQGQKRPGHRKPLAGQSPGQSRAGG